MLLSKKPNELQRHELYVGAFHNHSWTFESLCNYFHRLIEGSNIIDCHFYPCGNSALHDHSFAILTFASTSSIDQCLTKCDQIKKEHRLTVKRNLKETSKDQRPISKYILIHIDQFDRSFNKQNILAYFGEYGSIIQWKILDNGRTFLLNFKDYDSVDQIFLDQPHYLNEQSLSIRKCYNPYNVSLPSPTDSILKERKRNLQASIDRSIYLHESDLIKFKKKIQKEISVEEDRLSNIMKLCIRLERIRRDLKQDLIDVRQVNQKLKKQLQEAMQKNKRIVDDFENQLEQQRSINKSLQESILNFTSIY